jgi:peptide-methionine (S)-S-oxide reductase
MARKTTMPTVVSVLPGRSQPLPVAEQHFVSGNRIAPPLPAVLKLALFGMGSFWGAERLCRELPGVWSTAVGYGDLLQAFWENHDSTQGMRQGGGVGTQYRSAIFAIGDTQLAAARASRAAYQRALQAAGNRAVITTEIAPASRDPAAPAAARVDRPQRPPGSEPGSGSGNG